MLRPLRSDRWNFRTAAHLLNRAGFGGPPAAIERLVRLGLEGAVALLVDYERIFDPTPAPEWAKPDPDRGRRIQEMRQGPEEQRRQMQREEQRLQRQQMTELRGWWLERMATGPRPLQEKMTLFWHGHFATSVRKVRNAYYMWRQNELFRRLATGRWLPLLVEAARDPAMLIWLDQAQSRKEHPNENFAREVMELFALGEGHYTEKDVTEAARAFTGWSLDRRNEAFLERPRWHDAGLKTVLGRTGNLDGTAVLEQIVAQPQAAVFITGKIWSFFAGEMPAPALHAALAGVFRQSGAWFKPLLSTLFLSEEFYEARLIRNQVKSPVQWLVGSVRALGTELPPAAISSNLIRNLGQDLFAPPNVKGWDGGQAWITTSTLLARYNEAAVLLEKLRPGRDMIRERMGQRLEDRMRRFARSRRGAGEGRREGDFMKAGSEGRNSPRVQAGIGRGAGGRSGGVEVDKLLTPQERGDKESLMAALEMRLLQSRLSGQREKALGDYLGANHGWDDRHVLGAIRLIMSTPEYQVT